MPEKKTYYCEKCKRTMNGDQFYASNNLEKYPNDGKLPQCKKCLTMHVDNWNPDTYLWILQDIDVPYIPEEWNKLLASYGRDRSKVTGVTILGRYLSKMKLNQYNRYSWKDTDYLQELAEKKQREAMLRAGYGEVEISKAIEEGHIGIPEGIIEPPKVEEEENAHLASGNEDYFAEINGGDSDFTVDLTDEDRTYLRLKWGNTYRPEEWVQLEQLHEEMMSSYDIQTAGHKDTLKLMCKTSLKSNQLLDIGDVDGAQKMIKMYDTLMKSGKFTAAQNKAESGEYVDSVSELVAICETEGFIPRYYTDGPQDKVDRVLQDLQNYTNTLVTEDMNLGSLIENAVKQIEEDREKEARADAEAADDDEILENYLFGEQLDKEQEEIQDEDFEEFKEQEEELSKEDAEYLTKLIDGEVEKDGSTGSSRPISE